MTNNQKYRQYKTLHERLARWDKRGEKLLLIIKESQANIEEGQRSLSEALRRLKQNGK